MAVKCPKCQIDNPSDSKYCKECATPLPTAKTPRPEVTETLQTPIKELTTGSTFAGRYEIIKKLGQGGMGEVYKARDIRLDRIVAIKVMPPALAGNPDLRSRFEREAHAISILNHPHICTLYEFASHDGNDHIVLEYIEGETLASRLEKGSMKLDEALQIALQIADALDFAHQSGIIHRDMKPGNIMLAKTGAKLLDFGLAKLRAEVFASKGEHLPSRTITATAKGAIIGTLQYMAPEQLEGKDIDSRVDIFAFGAILYEMLTGRRAFEGKSSASVIAAILEREPIPASSLVPVVPRYIDRIISTCLAKEPEKRWQTASELQHVLRWNSEEAKTKGTEKASIRRPRLFWLYLAAAGTVLLGLGIIVGTKIFNRPAVMKPPQTVQKLNIQLQEKEAFAPVGSAPLGIGRPALALTPDGSKLVYVGEREGEGDTALYLRPLDCEYAQQLPGTSGAYNPFFSPDGQWVGFFSGNQLKKISTAGGEPIILCEVNNTYGATWSDDGKIYFAPQGVNLSRIYAEGGQPEVVAATDAKNGIYGFQWPQALPGGRGILFSNGILVLATHEIKALSGIVNPRYLPTGHLLYSRQGGLMAVPFDLERLEVAGVPLPVLDGIRTETLGAAQYAISNDGLLVFSPGQSAAIGRLVWVDHYGKVETLPFRPESYGAFRISPDGMKFAISIIKVTSHIWIFDLVGKGEPQRFSTEENEGFPVWTPDGTRIAFSGLENGIRNIFWRPVDRSRERERLVKKDGLDYPESWSPDGQWLSFIERPQGNYDISVFNVKTRELRPFSATRFNEWGSAFSPDGRWIAYTSDESGQYEVYVQPWPPTGRKWQVSKTVGGNEEPVWSKNSQELFYRNGRRWMAVPISTLREFSAGAPQTLFQGDYLNVSGLEYDVSADEKRFLVLQPADISPPTELRVIVNWFEELKRLTPAGKK